MEAEEEAPDAAYQWDKNVLYRIAKDGEDLYANTGLSLVTPRALPEGYNFLLVFEDGKAQAWKDGEELEMCIRDRVVQKRRWS